VEMLSVALPIRTVARLATSAFRCAIKGVSATTTTNGAMRSAASEVKEMADSQMKRGPEPDLFMRAVRSIEACSCSVTRAGHEDSMAVRHSKPLRTVQLRSDSRALNAASNEAVSSTTSCWIM